MIFTNRLVPILALVLGCVVLMSGCGEDSAAPQLESTSYSPGEDYSFPYVVEPEPFSGYICNFCDNAQSESAGLGWKDFEPERGVYDFSALEAVLSDADSRGKTISLYLHSINYSGANADSSIVIESQVPEWVFDHYELDRLRIPNLLQTFYISVIPQWLYGIDDDFNNMVRALGARYADDPRLASAYLHAISSSRGEELVLRSNNLQVLEVPKWGFSPSVLRTWITKRMDAYAEAFAGYEYKVAWVGKSKSLYWIRRPDYEQVSLDLLNYAWSKGFGNRMGAVERYFNEMNELALANEMDDDGYLVLDNSSLIFDGRYFGDENEEYGADWEWRFFGSHSDPHRYRMSMMRVLQQRYRWLWTSLAAESINPALSDYARLLFGKNVDNSPDAWSLLFEAPLSTVYTPAGVLKNFERFLYQRDYEGGVTVPTERLLRDFDAGGIGLGDETLFYEDTARRTDVASGNKYIYFNLDDAFISGGNPLIKVEIIDRVVTGFNIEFKNSAGATVSSSIAITNKDGQVKTYTFNLSDAVFENGMEHGTDFRIVNQGSADISVKWVRLIRGL